MRKLVLLLAFAASRLDAQAAPPVQSTLQRTELPVTAVSLFSSGVGYFEHNGTVRGNTSAELRFKTAQINDILKSLVLQDLDGGRVNGVTYPSQDPLSKTLRSFQVDIAGNPGLGDLLNQLRGSKVTITTQGERVSGIILGVESQVRRSERGEAVPSQMLNMLSSGVIRAVALTSINALALDDPEVRDELTKALAAVTQARDQDSKPVVINFAGAGNRRVRVGYVVETPIWKTSYRLLLDDNRSRLQGWAIVENQTDNDWNNISLSLVSGRPLSFIMNLYQPLYMARPTIVPELFGGLRSQLYESGLVERGQTGAPSGGRGGGAASGQGVLTGVVRDAESGKPVEGVTVTIAGTTLGALTDRNGMYQINSVPTNATLSVLARRVGYQTRTGSVLPGQMSGSFDFTMTASQVLSSVTVQEQKAPLPIDAFTSVQSIAEAARLGELFEYSIKNVTLARQKSAMLPIVTDSGVVQRVSIYNASVLKSNRSMAFALVTLPTSSCCKGRSPSWTMATMQVMHAWMMCHRDRSVCSASASIWR